MTAQTHRKYSLHTQPPAEPFRTRQQATIGVLDETVSGGCRRPRGPSRRWRPPWWERTIYWVKRRGAGRETGAELGLEMDSAVLFSKLKSGERPGSLNVAVGVKTASGCGGEEGAAGRSWVCGAGEGGVVRAGWRSGAPRGPRTLYDGPRAPSHSASCRLCVAPHPRPSSRAQRCVLDPRMLNYFMKLVRTLSLKLAFPKFQRFVLCPLLSLGPARLRRGPCPPHSLSLPAPESAAAASPTPPPDLVSADRHARKFPSSSRFSLIPQRRLDVVHVASQKGLHPNASERCREGASRARRWPRGPPGGTRVSPAGSLRSSCTAPATPASRRCGSGSWQSQPGVLQPRPQEGQQKQAWNPI